jgi:hypothetical protein
MGQQGMVKKQLSWMIKIPNFFSFTADFERHGLVNQA